MRTNITLDNCNNYAKKKHHLNDCNLHKMLRAVHIK